MSGRDAVIDDAVIAALDRMERGITAAEFEPAGAQLPIELVRDIIGAHRTIKRMAEAGPIAVSAGVLARATDLYARANAVLDTSWTVPLVTRESADEPGVTSCRICGNADPDACGYQDAPGDIPLRVEECPDRRMRWRPTLGNEVAREHDDPNEAISAAARMKVDHPEALVTIVVALVDAEPESVRVLTNKPRRDIGVKALEAWLERADGPDDYDAWEREQVQALISDLCDGEEFDA